MPVSYLLISMPVSYLLISSKIYAGHFSSCTISCIEQEGKKKSQAELNYSVVNKKLLTAFSTLHWFLPLLDSFFSCLASLTASASPPPSSAPVWTFHPPPFYPNPASPPHHPAFVPSSQIIQAVVVPALQPLLHHLNRHHLVIPDNKNQRGKKSIGMKVFFFKTHSYKYNSLSMHNNELSVS